MSEPVVLVEVVRSGFVESEHRGSVVATAADGSVEWSLGDISSPIFPRSCNKPLQAAAMLRCGLDLTGPLLALAGASHSGEPIHVEGVRKILAGAGLDETALQTPPDYPLGEAARIAWIESGAPKAPVAMNCSGKHAAMLATCVANGWPTDDYLRPGHPLQQAIRSTFATLTGEDVEAVGIDGCGAPVFATSLLGLARGFRALVVAVAGSPARRVVDAFAAHPEYASGTTRDEASLARAIPGAIVKAGAEACYAIGLPDGRAVAMKIADGSPRARPVLMAAVLRRIGLERIDGADLRAIEKTGRAPLFGGSDVVGEVRAVL